MDPRGAAAVDADQTIETHISLLELAGDRVYKFRKPVVTSFCDFSTRDARLADCKREVRLNRRLAPDVYLGVEERASAALGDEPDPCVVMRRLPAERQLSAMIAAGEDVRSHLRGVARQIVSLHEVADRGRQVTADGGWPAVRERWEQAFEQLELAAARGLIDAKTLATVATLGRRWLAGRRELYVERSRHHQIVDGHGDLRADNIFCLDDGPRILDCIEFDDRLRHIDIADEVAFLMMDLRRLGRANEAELFRGWYEELSGSTLPTPLVEHSVAYWALVRAKVAALRAEQGDPDAAAEARSLLTTAASQLHTFRPRLVLVGGLPASGKSTLAEGLGLATGWPVLSTDVLRKQRAGLADLASARSGMDQGLYEPDAVAATYDLLRQRADALLRRGFAVILDASWTDEDERRRAAALADDLAVDIVELRCAVDPETARQRLERRAGQPGASDAGPEVADALAARADPWPSAITVDTTASPSHAVDAALEAVR